MRGRTADLRDGPALAYLGGPFDAVARTVDVRRIGSARTTGRHNIPNVGVFAWRLKPYAITREPAYAREDIGPATYTFSVLGNDMPLFTLPVPEPGPEAIAEPRNVPGPIMRRVLERELETYYGPDRSFAIWAENWSDNDKSGLIPADKVIVADLSGWHYRPERGCVAVDPELGRFAFATGDVPEGDVHARYHYGFSDDTGGGAYPRTVRQPHEARVYSVGVGGDFADIGTALEKWRDEDPDDAVLEIVAGGIYTERLSIQLREGQSLQLRARNETRAVLRFLDYQAARADALIVQGEPGSRFTLDGIVVAGRGLTCRGPMAELRLRHATLVPGWSIGPDCEPDRPAKPSLELVDFTGQAVIERSILGSIQVRMDEVGEDPVRISITDSILDATSDTREAVGAPSWPLAHAVLTIVRTTVIGEIQTHAIELAEDSIFTGTVQVARRQIGCMRFCHVPAGSRTPRRYRCQPDLAERAAVDVLPLVEVGGPVSAPVDVGGTAEAGSAEPEAANLRLRFVTTNPAPAIGDMITVALSVDNLGPRVVGRVEMTIFPPRDEDDPNESPFADDPEVTLSKGALLDAIEPPIWEIGQLAPGDCAVLTARLEVVAVADPPQLSALISAHSFVDNGSTYIAQLHDAARSRMRPVFTSRRYGRPGYCQLDLCTDPGIREGASDQSEMGAFHDLFQPQRTGALSARHIGGSNRESRSEPRHLSPPAPVRTGPDAAGAGPAGRGLERAGVDPAGANAHAGRRLDRTPRRPRKRIPDNVRGRSVVRR
jgi:hypothetical protein